MLLSIYIIGASICICWFALAAIVIFENWTYENQDEEGKDSIDDMRKVLLEISPDYPQRAFLFFSIFITVFWPIMVPYIYYKSKFN